MEGSGCGGCSRVGEGAMRQTRSQLRGVEGIGGPGIWRRGDQCRSRQVICSDMRMVDGGEKGVELAYSHDQV